MAKTRSVYRCTECSVDHLKWAGQCSACQAWASLDEVMERRTKEVADARIGWSGGKAVAFSEVPQLIDPVQSTGLAEVDRALGGGLVAGSVTLLGGEPGIGKSTLLLQLAGAASLRRRKVLYVSAEESAAQLRRRAARLSLELDQVFVQAETSLPKILAEVERLDPDLLLVDSIQTVASPQHSSTPGSITQVRECAQAFIDMAKGQAMPTILVGHVTKEGTLAGPRTLEHLVDTVVSFEGDRHQRLRFLRAVKHRFGATGEPGVLEMTAAGLEGVPDPSGVFLADRADGATGSTVVPVLDGHRPLLVELQALIVPSRAASPRRAAQGIDTNRVSLLLAVLERRCGLEVLGAEAYVSVVGGVRVAEPGADLGVALSVASSVVDRPVPEDLIVCGEVGLAGELRQPTQLERRLDEASRLGFERAVVPASAPNVTASIRLLRAGSVSQAMHLAGLGAVAAAA